MSLCSECGSWKSKTLETRRDTRYGWKWRRRLCECGHEWATYEMPADTVQVDGEANQDGRLER